MEDTLMQMEDRLSNINESGKSLDSEEKMLFVDQTLSILTNLFNLNIIRDEMGPQDIELVERSILVLKKCILSEKTDIPAFTDRLELLTGYSLVVDILSVSFIVDPQVSTMLFEIFRRCSDEGVRRLSLETVFYILCIPSYNFRSNDELIRLYRAISLSFASLLDTDAIFEAFSTRILILICHKLVAGQKILSNQRHFVFSLQKMCAFVFRNEFFVENIDAVTVFISIWSSIFSHAPQEDAYMQDIALQIFSCAVDTLISLEIPDISLVSHISGFACLSKDKIRAYIDDVFYAYIGTKDIDMRSSIALSLCFKAYFSLISMHRPKNEFLEDDQDRNEDQLFFNLFRILSVSADMIKTSHSLPCALLLERTILDFISSLQNSVFQTRTRKIMVVLQHVHNIESYEGLASQLFQRLLIDLSLYEDSSSMLADVVHALSSLIYLVTSSWCLSSGIKELEEICSIPVSERFSFINIRQHRKSTKQLLSDIFKILLSSNNIASSSLTDRTLQFYSARLSSCIQSGDKELLSQLLFQVSCLFSSAKLSAQFTFLHNWYQQSLSNVINESTDSLLEDPFVSKDLLRLIRKKTKSNGRIRFSSMSSDGLSLYLESSKVLLLHMRRYPSEYRREQFITARHLLEADYVMFEAFHLYNDDAADTLSMELIRSVQSLDIPILKSDEKYSSSVSIVIREIVRKRLTDTRRYSLFFIKYADEALTHFHPSLAHITLQIISDVFEEQQDFCTHIDILQSLAISLWKYLIRLGTNFLYSASTAILRVLHQDESLTDHIFSFTSQMLQTTEKIEESFRELKIIAKEEETSSLIQDFEKKLAQIYNYMTLEPNFGQIQADLKHRATRGQF